MAADITLNVSSLPNITNIGSSTVTTVGGLRSSTNIPTNAPVITTDNGGGIYVYAGLYDGDYVDDTGNYIITANNRVWRRLFSPENAKNFGVIGSQTSDSLETLNRAVAATPTGGKLVIPSGENIISNTLVINKPITIEGQGNAFGGAARITPSSSFPSGAPLIHFTNPLGRSAIYNICSFMGRRGGDWIKFDGDVSNIEVEGCHVRQVSTGHWGLNFDSPSAINGAFLLQIINNLFVDFDGGAIRADKGGDSCNILRNCFQLINSTSHLLYWNGKTGTSHLNFSENNATGASKFIWIDGVMQAKIQKNQLEATTVIDNTEQALIVIGGDIASDSAIGYDISDNNLNGHDGNALTAIHLKGCRDTFIKNNGIFGVTNSVKSTTLTRNTTFFPGFTEGVVNDAFNAISIFHGSGESVLQGDLRISGLNNRGLKFGKAGDDTSGTSFFDVDLWALLTASAARIRFFRQTNTTGGKSIDIYRGNGTNSLQHSIDPNGNTLLNLLGGSIGLGVNNPIGKLDILGSIILRAILEPEAPVIPYSYAVYVDDYGVKIKSWTGTVQQIDFTNVEQEITQRKTFTGFMPVIINGNYIGVVNATTNPAGWAFGISGDSSGHFVIANANSDIVALTINKTTNAASFVAAASAPELRALNQLSVGVSGTINGKAQIAGDVTANPATNVYGQLELTGATTPALRLSLGYNVSGDYGFIQAIFNAAAYKPIVMNASGGQVSIGTASIDPSAKFQVDSSTQGLLPPRMTTAQRTAIASPGEGLYVYDLDLHKPFTWDGTAWQPHF